MVDGDTIQWLKTLTAQHLKNINEMPFRILQSARNWNIQETIGQEKWNFYH